MRIILLFTLLASLPVSLAAQTIYTTAESPYPLENSGHSPRAMALGNAFAAVEGDASCLFYNPAGLGKVTEGQISLVHQSWIADISRETFLVALPFGKSGGFALSANYLHFGTLDQYDGFGFPTTPDQPFRGSVSLGLGFPLAQDFFIGFSGRGLVQSLVYGAMDISSSLQGGFLWRAVSNLRFGASYSFNFDASPGLGFLRAGAAWSPALLPKEPTLLLMDFSLPIRSVGRIHFGAEQFFLGALFVRLGYQLELDDNRVAGFRGLTGGLGFDFHDFNLDYSFTPKGDLGFSHTFGLTFRLPGEKKGNQAPAAANSPPPQYNPLPTDLLPTPIGPLSLPGSQPAVSTSAPAIVVPPTPTGNSSVNFAPPSKLSPNDKVIKVETRFQIPNTSNSTTGDANTPSPQLRALLEAAGKRVEQTPKDARAWVELGNLYWQAGQADFTIQCFREALRLQPDNTALKTWLDRYYQAHPGGH